MQFIKTRGAQVLLAAAVIAVLAMPVSIAAASGHTASRPSSAKKQIKALKKQVAILVRQVAALTANQAALEGRQGPAIPTSLPPSGPAGGALTGAFPEPTLAPDAVGSLNIADGSIQSEDIADGSVQGADIADGSIGAADIGPDSIFSPAIADRSIQGSDIGFGAIDQSDLQANSVGAGNLKSVFEVAGAPVMIPPGAGEFKSASVQCPAGSKMLSGGFEWGHPERVDHEISMSAPSFHGEPQDWTVWGRIDNGLKDILLADALCMGG